MTVLIAASGFVPTISQHSFHDVAITITDTASGQAVPHLPFKIIYSYAPTDSPLFYHVELRTPPEVRAETNTNGRAVVKMADYAWDITVEVDEAKKGTGTVSTWTRNWFAKAALSTRGIQATNIES